MKGILVWCDEHKLPIRYCIRQVLNLDSSAKVGIKEWCKYMKALTGDPGCMIWVRKTVKGNPDRCKHPALFWTKTPWGCGCTVRVCKKHSRRRKISEDSCRCPARPPMVGRGGGGGEPSPWQENAIRLMEGDIS